MKNGRMQAKDVPDLPVLRFIHHVRTEGVIYRDPLKGRGTFDCDGDRFFHVTWFVYDGGFVPANSVRHAMPPGTPDKVVLAKMRRLIERGLVDGCPCGCRGDYGLTDRGRAAIGHEGDMRVERVTALQGKLLDADGSVLADYFEAFNLTPQATGVMSQPLGSIGIHAVSWPVGRLLEACGYSQVVIVNSDRAESRVEIPVLFESLPCAEHTLKPAPDYLQHDPTKNVRRRKRDPHGYGWATKGRGRV